MGAAVSPMTEKRADDSKERDQSAVVKPQELSLEHQRQARKDIWEALNKALNTLMVGHAAGLVTCLTLLKDYKDNSQLEGLGWFIVLFGYGLIVAASSVLIWTLGAANRVFLPKRIREKPFDIPHPQLFWTTAACALISTALMAAAILIGIFKFGTL
jgi:hypothetical protein